MKLISQNKYLIVSTGIPANIFKPAVGDLKQWRHDRAVRMPTFRNFSNMLLGPLPPYMLDQSVSISHCQCTLNSHHNLMINHYCPKRIIILQDSFILLWTPVGCNSDKIQVVHKDTHSLWLSDLSLATIDLLSPNTCSCRKNGNLWFSLTSNDLTDTCI